MSVKEVGCKFDDFPRKENEVTAVRRCEHFASINSPLSLRVPHSLASFTSGISHATQHTPQEREKDGRGGGGDAAAAGPGDAGGGGGAPAASRGGGGGGGHSDELRGRGGESSTTTEASEERTRTRPSWCSGLRRTGRCFDRPSSSCAGPERRPRWGLVTGIHHQAARTSP